MSELHAVLRAIEEHLARGRPMALATIVGVRGSTYRREGARLLLPEDGPMVGTISGGCLEGEVARVAGDVMADGRPRLLHFDLTADDEAVWGWGLGCNGVIDVFVEPADRAAETARALRLAMEEQRALAVATVVEAIEEAGTRPGDRLLVHPDGESEGSLGSPRLDARALEEATARLAGDRPGVVELSPGVRAFVEALLPPPRLVVCGAGHDAVPLVGFAVTLGFRPEVVDDREAFLSRDRFPGAVRFVRSEPIAAAAAVAPDERTYVVVMSHNFLRDKDYLRSFLGSDAPYLGMLGPAARTHRLLDQLRREGYEPAPDHLRAVHAPAGLDLGAEGPEEIAWAILAEVLAVKNRRSGGFLKDRRAPIHDRPPVAPATR